MLTRHFNCSAALLTSSCQSGYLSFCFTQSLTAAVFQVFAHTNDLNEKDDTIAHLKMREASLEGLLAANDRMHEQDAIVRLQLGKRLEQVLLDKEEAYEELDLFKVRCGEARQGRARPHLHGRTPPLTSIRILSLLPSTPLLTINFALLCLISRPLLSYLSSIISLFCPISLPSYLSSVLSLFCPVSLL